MNPRGPKLRQDQRKYLKERLSSATSKHRSKVYRTRRDPPSVAAARKVANRYDEAVCRQRDIAVSTLQAEERRLTEAILFADPAHALDMIKEYEKKQFIPAQLAAEQAPPDHDAYVGVTL